MAKARLTPYASYVFSNVKEYARQGRGVYSYDELAAAVGLKPTHNFRKRINGMVADGTLKLCPAFTPRGGIENRFHYSEVNPIEVIPF